MKIVIVLLFCSVALGVLHAADSDGSGNDYSEDEIIAKKRFDVLFDLRPWLWRAAHEGDVPGLVELVRDGVSVDAADCHGVTALMLAAHSGHCDAVKFLLTAGADVNAAMGNGITAIMLAAHQGHRMIVDVLLGARADLGVMTAEHETVLTIALPGADWYLICTLLDAEGMRGPAKL